MFIITRQFLGSYGLFYFRTIATSASFYLFCCGFWSLSHFESWPAMYSQPPWLKVAHWLKNLVMSFTPYKSSARGSLWFSTGHLSRCYLSHVFALFFHLVTNGTLLPPLSVKKYATWFSDKLKDWSFVLVVQIGAHNIFAFPPKVVLCLLMLLLSFHSWFIWALKGQSSCRMQVPIQIKFMFVCWQNEPVDTNCIVYFVAVIFRSVTVILCRIYILSHVNLECFSDLFLASCLAICYSYSYFLLSFEQSAIERLDLAKFFDIWHKVELVLVLCSKVRFFIRIFCVWSKTLLKLSNLFWFLQACFFFLKPFPRFPRVVSPARFCRSVFSLIAAFCRADFTSRLF